MTVDNDGVYETRNTAVAKKDAEVTCWNCLSGESFKKDVEPIPLHKVRKQHREQLRLYSFLASQVTKPKAVSLKQRVSENYSVAKKVDERIMQEKSTETNFVDAFDQQFNTISSEFRASPEIGKTPTLSQVSQSRLFAIENELNCLADELKNTSILDKASNNVEQDLQERVLEEIVGGQVRNEVRMTPESRRRIAFENEILPKLSKSPHFAKKIISIDTEGSLKSISPEYVRKTSLENEMSSKFSRSSELVKKSASLEREVSPNFSESNEFVKNILSAQVSPKLSQSSEYMSKTVSPRAEVSPKISEESSEYVKKRLSLKIDAPPERKEVQISPKSPDHVKVLSKVLVETSTPRIKRTIEKDVDSHKYSSVIEFKKKGDDIIEELADEIDTAATTINSGRTSSTSDKIDNVSCSGSDSGYAESSSTAESKENATELSSPELSSTPEPVNKSCLKQDFKSSLPALTLANSIAATSSTSLYTPRSPSKKVSEKYIRWSTLSIHQKPISFGDETYISDTVSPGHATLPRRSNSPLPHERDLGDRFSLNRSGLQARSESMASVYSGAGEGTRGNVTVRGDVQFSLLYNYRLGALEVGVRRCRDLAPVDTKRNRSDPYVKVYLLPDKSKTGKRKTKVKKNTLNPIFEETLSFVQPLATLSSRTLWLSVWHADMFGRNDFLGEVTLPLADVVFDDPKPVWHKLLERTEQFDEQQGTRGDLIIGLKFELPEPGARAKGTLHVLVKEAKNVVATKPNGLADVFCKSYLLPERGRLAKQKTNVCRRTLCPRWEHTFTYRGLTMQELASRALELSLWDRDRLASNDFMGAVRLSLGTGTYMGANVNWMDSVGKEVSLWQTMMQRPNFWVEGSLPLRPQLNHC